MKKILFMCLATISLFGFSSFQEKSGAITITFNAAVAAPFTKFVKISSNSKTPLKMLYIKGEVIASAGN